MHFSCTLTFRQGAKCSRALQAAAGYGPSGLVLPLLTGHCLVSRLESFQGTESILGVIPLEGIGMLEGKSVLSLGLYSVP